MATNTFPQDGNVGIGTTAPDQGQLEIQTSAPAANQGLALTVDGGGTVAQTYVKTDGSDDYNWFFTRGADNKGLQIDKNGNVTLGKNLTVTGDINIQNWTISVPDYVFGENYPLMSLEKLGAYVREHRHLPGIPAEPEMTRDGMNLSHMNLKLLEKVEELTLYLLEHQTRLGELSQRLEAVEKAIQESS